MSTMPMEDAALNHWRLRLDEFVPGFVASHASFAPIRSDCAILLHGSTTFGIDDPHSDLDLWVLTNSARLAEFDRASATRFIEFTLDGKKGHFNVDSIEHFQQRMSQCYFPLIAELCSAVVLHDPKHLSEALLKRARQPMSDEVLRAWFCYHYVEMRGEHRACDNPIERGHVVALLIAFTKTVEHAIRAACILDRKPYHYSKWLAPMAAQFTTGARLVALVNESIAIVSGGGLLAPGPEQQHELSLKLREIRAALTDAARREGIDEPWLAQWWLHIDPARTGIHAVTW
jgi:hypothetical protein